MPEDSIKYGTSTIAEMTNGIILAHFEKGLYAEETSYQSEAELEKEFIRMLTEQGYEYLPIHFEEDMATKDLQ